MHVHVCLQPECLFKHNGLCNHAICLVGLHAHQVTLPPPMFQCPQNRRQELAQKKKKKKKKMLIFVSQQLHCYTTQEWLRVHWICLLETYVPVKFVKVS